MGFLNLKNRHIKTCTLNVFFRRIILINSIYIFLFSVLSVLNILGLQGFWAKFLWLHINGLYIIFPPILIIYTIIFLIRKRPINIKEYLKTIVICSLLNILIFYGVILLLFIPFFYKGEGN